MSLAAALAIFLGSIFLFLSALGVLRLPDLYSRMSATSKASTLGAILTLLGTALLFAEWSILLRVLTAILFLLLTTPVSAHMIARAGYRSGIRLWSQSVHNDLESVDSPRPPSP